MGCRCVDPYNYMQLEISNHLRRLRSTKPAEASLARDYRFVFANIHCDTDSQMFWFVGRVYAPLIRRCLLDSLNNSSRKWISQNAIREGITGMVGNTPMVKLHRVSKETGCEILAKAEFCNGGGSIKDRAALYLIKDAEKKGLTAGGTIVEGTAGNTGIGLAHMCLASGYQFVFYLPDTQSQEKMDLLRTLGADVRPVPVVPFSDPNNFNHQARTYAENTENAVWTNQFDNTANMLAHLETTGPEIWNDTNGRVDAVVFGTGTAGTLAGVGIYLKEKNPKVQVFAADPQGSVLYHWFNDGDLKASEGISITEGIGQGRITKNMELAPVDGVLLVKDFDVVEMTFRLLHEDGFFVGASSGLNVAAAVQVAKLLGPGHTIVTALCDGGMKYYARLFSRDELERRGLLEAVPPPYRRSLH